MKPLLFVLALAMSHVVVYSQTGTEDSVYWYDANLADLNSPFYSSRNILKLGVQHAITEGIQFGTLPPGNYYIEDVLSIENGDDDPYFYHRFNVLLGDDQGNFIKLIFIHSENLQTMEKRITHYEFVESSGQVDFPFASWETVDKSELDTNQDLRDSWSFGSDYVIAEGRELRLLSTNYDRTQIYSIRRQSDDDDGMNYRFNLKLKNSQGGYAHVIFIVHSPSDGEKEVTSYYFLEIGDGGEIGNGEDIKLPSSEDSEDEDTEDDNDDSGNSEESDSNDDDDDGFEDLGEWDPDDFEDDFSDIWEHKDLTILNTNSDYREALNLGVRSVIAEAIQYGYLPPVAHHIEDVLSIRWSDDFNYRFAVVLADDQGKETIITFGVFEYPDGLELANYKFGLDEGEEEPPVEIWEEVDVAELETNQDLRDSLNYGIQDLMTELGKLPEDYHQREIYSILRQPDDEDGVYYRFNINLWNDQGGNVHIIFEVHSHPEGDKVLTSHYFIEIRDGAPSVPDEETNGEEFD